ncbi:SGNH/GDSL hydrolase family protein [Marinobacter vulgaris]|nr:SGNH/GDSL hydrolase family protein [Marinobacter vulgaris]
MKNSRIGRFFKQLCLTFGMAFAATGANAFDSIYIFGDSLSDTGNAAILTGGVAPERFSNGPVAVDILASSFDLQAIPNFGGGTNYAIGGARALGSDSEFDTNLPSQVNSYLQFTGSNADPAALYVVIIGGNDIFDAQAIRAGSVTESFGRERQAIRKEALDRVSDAVASIEAQVIKLYMAGARNILVGNAPDVALTPQTDVVAENLLAVTQTRPEERRAEKLNKRTSRLTATFNKELAAAVARVEALASIDILEWDLAEFLSNQIEDAETVGFTNVDDSCIADGRLPACTGYVFFDNVHPTTLVHQRAGQDLLQLLKP